MVRPAGVVGGRTRRATTVVVPALALLLQVALLVLEVPSRAAAAFVRLDAGSVGLRRHRATNKAPFGLRAESDARTTAGASASPSPSQRPRPPDEAPEPDLFEYFDPLLSPHAYPHGIVPPSNNSQQALEEDDEAVGDGDNAAAAEVPSAAREGATTGGPVSSSSAPSDRRPPSVGGGGGAAGVAPASSRPTSTPPSRPAGDGNEDPLRLDRLQFLGVPHPDPKKYKKEDYDQVKLDNLNFLGVGTGQSAWPRDEIGLPVVDTYASVFDPTLSPHKYPRGTPSEVLVRRPEEDVEVDDALSARSTIDSQAPSSSSSSSIVGILLIDHGSKNDSSNQRLHDMASWYQECVQSVAVEAAHMEIATPSIKEGMAKLLERGAEEIVCHPYFLGSGRHVSEDIPRLIEEAMDELDVEVPVRTTAHVGSDMAMMLEAVHALVKQSSTLLVAPSRADRS